MIKQTTTPRGFKSGEFKDYYDIECSIQESSLASPGAIWLGVNESDPKVMNKDGMGWQSVELPEGTLCNTRMHLTQEQVKALLPLLEYFVETSYLPRPGQTMEKRTIRHSRIKPGLKLQDLR